MTIIITAADIDDMEFNPLASVGGVSHDRGTLWVETAIGVSLRGRVVGHVEAGAWLSTDPAGLNGDDADKVRRCGYVITPFARDDSTPLGSLCFTPVDGVEVAADARLAEGDYGLDPIAEAAHDCDTSDYESVLTDALREMVAGGVARADAAELIDIARRLDLLGEAP